MTMIFLSYPGSRVNKGNNKITELRTILQRESQNVSSNPTYDLVYSIQHYVIKFVSDLRQVGGFLWVLRFPPPIELKATI
jgi:hypothetical protein